MFVTMMALLRVCTNVRALNEISTAKRVFTGLYLTIINNIQSYLDPNKYSYAIKLNVY